MTSLRSTTASTLNKSTASSAARPTVESTSGRLEIAQKLLLAPFGLTQAHLGRALAEITSHGADDADLYFQYTRSEGWSLEEGIVKTGSFSIDQGVGVRAVSGEKTAFAYSDDISEASLLDAARTASNPVVLSGDVHTFFAAELRRDPARGASAGNPVIATEFCGTSVTSSSRPQARTQQYVDMNRDMHFGRSDRRGFMLLDLRPERAAMAFQALDDVRDANSGLSTLASFSVSDGKPGARRQS